MQFGNKKRNIFSTTEKRTDMATANSLNLIQDDTGTYIPATQRPDGSWRKARRVRDGYIPQDEMPLYESKGKQFAKNQPLLPVGLDESYVIAPIKTAKKIPGLSNVATTETKPTKAAKKKKKKSTSTPKQEVAVPHIENLNISTKAPEDTPVATDPTKRIRNLRKKLKDINALRLKIESGELANPDKDQLEKIKRQTEIEDEIEDLELLIDA